MVAIFDLLVILTLESIHISCSMLVNPKNVGVAIGFLSLSCIQAEICVIAYLLTVMVAIFDFPTKSLLHRRIFALVPTCYWTSKKVLSVGSLVVSRLNHVISFTSGLPTAILIFIGVASNIVRPEKLERMCLCSLTDRWKPHEKIPIRSRDRFDHPWATMYTEKAWATAG